MIMRKRTREREVLLSQWRHFAGNLAAQVHGNARLWWRSSRQTEARLLGLQRRFP
jgi:hypothetical protein